jgi:hypothetical protein
MNTPILTETAYDIVRSALLQIGKIDANQPLKSLPFQDGLKNLNRMIKSWQSQGLHLWTKTEGVVFLDVGKTNYSLGPAGDEVANADEFINATLTVAALLGATVLDIDTAGMTDGDNIGIELDDGTRQWTTIVTVDSAVQATVTTGLLDSSAISNTVFTFTNLIPRPLRLLQLRRFTVGQNDEIEAIQWSRQQYFAQTDKTSQGTVNNWYYSPELSNGKLYLWQTASSVRQVANFTYERPINITTENLDNPDFPSEWFDTLVFNLAARIGAQYTIPVDKLNTIRDQAQILLANSLGYDQEPTSLNIQPDFGGF